MNVDGLIGNLQGTFSRLGHSLVVQGDGRFGDALTIGQVIKGKVLLHYEGSRYGVRFGNEQKVVDSAVPLKTGEVIYGRVVALGEQVHLRRALAMDIGGAANSAGSSENGLPAGMSANERMVAQLIARYQGSLTLREHALLQRMMARVEKPELSALSALVLNKAGIGLNNEAVAGVLRVLERERPAALKKFVEAPRLELNADAQISGEQDMLWLGRALQRMIEWRDDGALSEVRHSQEEYSAGSSLKNEADSDPNGGRDHREEHHLLGTWLLNRQADGAMAHRLATFPVWFGDSLVEVSVALFNQRKQDGNHGELRHRRIVLALDTARLGHVELIVNVARENLCVEVRAQDDEPAEAMAQHLNTLRAQLMDIGWNVDGISYVTIQPGMRGEVVRSVVEHFVAQDSVNQLI